MISKPPFIAGAVHVTVAELIPATAEMPVGASGTVAGVTADEAKESKESPTAFVAKTVNVIGVPFSNPVTVVVSTLPRIIWLPMDGVTVYPVIADPPFEGAVHENVADALPRTAERPVGASGIVHGITAADAKEAIELPTPFIETTVNVIGVPLVRLVNVAVGSVSTVIGLPTEGVTVYPVIAEPPSKSGAVQVTVAEALSATAETSVGAPGTVGSVTAVEAEETNEVPKEFIAFTVNVSDAPAANPPTVAVRTLPTFTAVPVEGVTVYPVIVKPPFEAGAIHETTAELIPAVASTAVGASGIPNGVTAVVDEEADEVPEAVVVFTVNVTETPLVSPVSVAVVTAPTFNGLPTEGVTVYPVTPVEAEAVQVTVAALLPATAETPVGAIGSDPKGVIAAEAVEAAELPT